MFKKNKSVKEFFDFYVNPDERELFNKYRDKVFEAFYPRRGYNYKFKDGKQAISDFKKLGTSADLLADRAGKIVSDTGGIGWGFHDYLCEVHSDFYTDNSDYIDEPKLQLGKGKIINTGGQCQQPPLAITAVWRKWRCSASYDNFSYN